VVVVYMARMDCESGDGAGVVAGWYWEAARRRFMLGEWTGDDDAEREDGGGVAAAAVVELVVPRLLRRGLTITSKDDARRADAGW
jgi:hypothetical protein